MTVKSEDNIGIDFCIKCGTKNLPPDEMATSSGLGNFISHEQYVRPCFFFCSECCHDFDDCEVCDELYERWLASK